MYGFRVAFNTIFNFIPDVCEAIIQEYAEDAISCPTTPEEWKQVAGPHGVKPGLELQDCAMWNQERVGWCMGYMNE